jgi:2-oxoisovalerate dehydrogenase E1 component
MLVHKAVVAAQQLEQRRRGVSIEVIDLRSLSPYDWEAIRTSVRKTSRVIVAHEDCLSWGYGAEISARITNELFDHLDAPIGRIGALDTWVAYNPKLEDEILPQTEDLVRESERILNY